jgi:hypothetical protein
MKFKATKSQMRTGYNRIISIGYCDAQYLLHYENPTAYSAGNLGWSCDYYDIDGVLISTGYSPLSDKNAKHDYDTIRDYDKQAEKIVCDYNAKYEDKQEKVKQLLREFVKAVTAA